MPTWGSLYFQDGVSPVMEQMIFFHDHTMMVMLLIMIVVGYLLVNSMIIKEYEGGNKVGQSVEALWTVMPVFVLLIIAFPSLRLLYLMDEGFSPDITVSVIGRQWYWSYELPEVGVDEFDSYMIVDGVRLVEVDKSLVLPVMTSIRAIVSASDVIHSWTIPSVGVKVDAVPGRLNQLNLYFNRVGWFVGQCSEICGANHSFMPIFVKVVWFDDFLAWY